MCDSPPLTGGLAYLTIPEDCCCYLCLLLLGSIFCFSFVSTCACGYYVKCGLFSFSYLLLGCKDGWVTCEYFTDFAFVSGVCSTLVRGRRRGGG